MADFVDPMRAVQQWQETVSMSRYFVLLHNRNYTYVLTDINKNSSVNFLKKEVKPLQIQLNCLNGSGKVGENFFSLYSCSLFGGNGMSLLGKRYI